MYELSLTSVNIIIIITIIIIIIIIIIATIVAVAIEKIIKSKKLFIKEGTITLTTAGLSVHITQHHSNH